MKLIPVTGLALLSMGFSLGASAEYVLHEWGTFTSVYASNGKMLPGLQREEEALPHFVYSHDGMKVSEQGFARGKGLLRPLRGVTVKMETPVIYFYSEKPFKGSVEVGFAGGSISQWFPGRQGGETVPVLPRPFVKDGKLVRPPKDAGLIDFSDGKFNGGIKWDFEVLDRDPAHEGKVFRAHETVTWLRPRQTASNVVKVGDEYEKYLFYRGLGNFEMPVRFQVDSQETLQISNDGEEAIPYALVFEMKESYQIGFHELKGGIKPGESATVSRDQIFPEAAQLPNGQMPLSFTSIGPHYEKMVAGLMGSGLRRDEADAMVQTWWHSYFQRPGLRVFWVVPRAETDRVLPLKISPTPKEMVRVLVGRSEVLRPEFEQKLVQAFRAEKQDDWNRRKADRFGVAYETRVKELTDAPVVTKVER